MTAEAALGLSGFMARLAGKHDDPDVVFALRLAESGLARAARPPAAAPAIVVLGPTQTGKSTVVNLLSGGGFVETSPLAAHTRRAALLAVNTDAPEGGFDGSLDAGQFNTRRVERDAEPCLIWDTPDFDSNASLGYRQDVARVCGLADLIVVVLSKEKYADQSVWSVLETLAPLATPVVVCLNKCEPGSGDADTLLPVIRRRLEEDPVVNADTPVMALPRAGSGSPDELLAAEDARHFRALVLARLETVPAAARAAALERLVRAQWHVWIGPVMRELACQREWQRIVAAHADELLERYRAEYIDHTRHHDVAQKAVLGLLELLEVPALAGPMGKARRALTWPFRKAMNAFGRGRDPGRDQETEVAEAALEHCLLSLRHEASSHSDPWWRALAAAFPDAEAGVRTAFREALARYRQAFQPRIDQLSEDLYRRLEHNPVTLNTLRATRLGADAGGVVLAIQTGTLGLYDALFAPAVISLTSYLTESAVGQYLSTVVAGLKREQLEQVGAVVRVTVEQPLGGMQPAGPALFGVTGSGLERARDHLDELAP